MKLFRKILYSVLSFFGLDSILTSCSYIELPVMAYGAMPVNLDYTVYGTVTDEDGNIVEGIEYSKYKDAMGTSVRNGKYYVDYDYSGNYTIYFVDADGEENGLFENKEVEVNLTETGSTRVDVVLKKIK